MNTSEFNVDRAIQAQIDRLVTGDLPESERSNLLAWLDEDVRRWRPCALAFLEAQTWEAAAGARPAESLAGSQPFGSVDYAASTTPAKDPGGDSGRVKGESRAKFHALAALALSIAAALVVGTILGRQWTELRR